jgi:uncharacterized protein YjbI with pentapeptide repeats
MKFDKVLTEQMYSEHLLWLDNYNTGKRLDLTGANLDGANLSYANLTSANLSYANLIGAIITGANLSYANLTGANLTRAILYGANLIDANLSYANLSRANLTGANLLYANLTSANLSYAALTDANLSYAYLSCANLTNIKFNNCIGNNNQIKNLHLPTYKLVLCNNILAIGCKQYSVEEWYSFSNDTIADMDTNALAWWTTYKDFIRQWIDISK